MADINYAYNKVTDLWEPTKYPVKQKYDMDVPDSIKKDFNQLTYFIEDKYAKEYLKVCAFYNKMFMSLKHADWSRVSYNTVPFTMQDQERTDTGTGMSSNYLKSAIDLVVSRLGNNTFEYNLISETPTVKFTIYREEIERLLRSLIRKNKLWRVAVESFHDAAILGFAHAFIDPWSNTIRKLPDWELGLYESEFNEGRLKRVVIRDFAFPIASIAPYIKGFPEDTVKEWARAKSHVDLRLYIDCFRKEKYVAINDKMGPASPYDFDEVLIASYSWDIGTRRTTIASLFDTLYPIQRSINKLLAKKTQILTMYKGPVPVFSGGADMDVVVKQLSNGSGEVLFLDTQRKPADLMTTLECTPLDPNLNAEMESLKAQIFELAGVQQISMDIENYRSAAAVAALDSMRDAGFQSQLSAAADYIREIALCAVKYMSKMSTERLGSIGWEDVYELINDAYIDVKPISKLGLDGKSEQQVLEPDYMLRHIEQFLIDICKGNSTFDNIDFSLNYHLLKQRAALHLVEYKAIERDSEEIQRLTQFLVDCFVEDIRRGTVDLVFEDSADLPMSGQEGAQQ